MKVQEAWNKITEKYTGANFLQSPEWGKVNEILGHKVILEHLETDAWVQMIVKNAKRGRYIEIPCGPLMDWQNEAVVQKVLALITEQAKAQKCAFIRIRPQLMANKENLQLLEKLGFRKAPMHLAAEHTVIIDLTKSEDELLAEMRRQTRYEVRRSAKLQIKVEHGNSEELFREFHKVQMETAARQHFVPPKLATLLAEREAFGERAQIYVAKTSDNEPIAYGLILGSGAEAAYYEAASTELNHKLPGAYALEWQVMKDLKAAGVKRYNLWGIAPAGAVRHRYAGVTTFKTGFGGKIVEFVPAQDLVINRVKYSFDWLVETARKKKRHL